MKKGKQTTRRPGPGRAKVVPRDWERRAWFVRPWTAYALDILARREQVPVSLLVDKVLTAYARRHRVKVPAPPRGVQGPNGG